MLIIPQEAICKFAKGRVALYSVGTGNGTRSRFSHKGKMARTITENWRWATAFAPHELAGRIESRV